MQEAEQWWSGCYVPPAAALLAAAHPYWTIITGGPGSGKSVALAAMSRQLATSTFLIPYPTTRWPGGAYAWLKQADNHLEQMMAAASFALRDQFQQNPAQAANLPDLQKEFVRWLLQKVGGERAYHRWLQALPSEVAAAYDPIEYDDLFPNPNDPLDVQGQIDELVCLARTLGWERVVFMVDVSTQDIISPFAPRPLYVDKPPSVLDRLTTLFGWLELMQHPGLSLIAAVPQPLLYEGDVVQQARGRVTVYHLQWSMEQGEQIAARHIAQALALPTLPSMNQYVTPTVLMEMSHLIASEYTHQAPSGWVALAETILYLAHRPASPLVLPLAMDQLPALKHAFYERHLHLRLDNEAHGVWRGPRFIPLDERPLELLNLLYQRRGRPINWDDEPLRQLALSKSNVHSIVSRTRKSIEPLTNQPVYLRNSRGEGGYWLEPATLV